jgi:hypothetical protein
MMDTVDLHTKTQRHKDTKKDFFIFFVPLCLRVSIFHLIPQRAVARAMTARMTTP